MMVSCSGGGSATKSATAATPPEAKTAVASSTDPFQITTDLGVVRGAPSAVDGVRAFLAVPYAAPPTGENRWRAPQPRAPYEGVFDATAVGRSCPQDTSTPADKLIKVPPTTEDCLTLSVWSPVGARGVPVMVFIHGGGLVGGSAHAPLYTGNHLAARGVVVIDVNYRIGVFGFLSTDELARDSADGSSGGENLAGRSRELYLHWDDQDPDRSVTELQMPITP